MNYKWRCLSCDWRSKGFKIAGPGRTTTGFGEKQKFYEHVTATHGPNQVIEAGLTRYSPLGQRFHTGTIIRHQAWKAQP
jgi:hypothetical protein